MNAIKFFLYFGLFNLCLSVLYTYLTLTSPNPILWLLVVGEVLLSIYLIRVYITFPYRKRDFK